MAIPGRGPRELCAAPWAVGLRRCARLLALMSQKVAECGKLSSVASMFPALRLGSLVENPHLCLSIAWLCHDIVGIAGDESRRI